MGSYVDASALLTHLSLSLSLCSQFLSAENGAPTDFLAGRGRAFERGVWSFSPARAVRGLFERRCLCPSPVVAFEEAPVRVPSRAGVVCAERRGLIGPGSRRSPSSAATGAAGCSGGTNCDSYNHVTTKETR